MKKRILIVKAAMTLIFAAVCMSTWADEVTEKQALEQAQQFVSSHNTRKSAPTVKSAGQVSGLYVFNVSNGGFVIVSNDDQTVPILGFGESGNIDPDDLPDNMRAWLQGYADQIAWLQAQDTQNTKSRQAAQRKAPQREPEGNESSEWKQGDTKKEIGPLISTTWNQNKPYNNQCPEYETGKRCATGCVATAYAQVMYYTETVTHNNTTTVTTEDIPGYTTRNGKHTLPAIAKGTTIDWSAMIADYSGNYTDAQAAAVANMMLICGCAVKMNYNQESGAYTTDVATALKTYFGYAETTRYVNRSCYTYANWTDLIYSELSKRRPVVYAGQGTDVGHEFVCDGYKYENGDLFHINWGWGGVSDGYFVLSVLNPDEQGIGGSPSSSAFTRGQEAVIGIQKEGDTGTVLNVPTTEPNSLTINSITLSHSTIALGESVNVTVNVTNNSATNVYDGEIYLPGLGGGMFVIPANGTQNCVITVTPTKATTYTVQAKYYTGTTSEETSTCSASLTVKDQTPTSFTTSNVELESATIGWTNVGNATKWNLRSMPVTFLTEDFNGSMNEWRLIRSSKDDTNGVNGTPCVKFGNDGNNQWLVSPKITLGGIFSFYAWKSGDTAETFHVLYSKSKDSNTFYYIKSDVEATATPTKYTIDLCGISGEGRVAIIHTGGTEGSYLYVDDATIIEPVGNWTTVSNLTTNSHSLTGLTTTPRYVVQVQAVNNDGGNWSEPFVLTTSNNTFELPNNDSEATTKNVELLKRWNGISANVTLTGRTLYKDGEWNTLCLPFDVTIAGSPLADADVRALDNANLNGGTLTLNFTAASAVTKIVAGTPYIIKWGTPDNHPTANLTDPKFTSVTINRTYNDFSSNGVQFLGCYSSRTFTEDNTSILFLGSENKLYWPKSGATIGACRAYFMLDGSVSAARQVTAFSLIFGDGSSETGIESLSADSKDGKDGADAWYSLDGVRLSGKPTQRGIYINNGRKVIY